MSSLREPDISCRVGKEPGSVPKFPTCLAVGYRMLEAAALGGWEERPPPSDVLASVSLSIMIYGEQMGFRPLSVRWQKRYGDWKGVNQLSAAL